MDTCHRCLAKSKDDIISLPARGVGYTKKDCIKERISYPLKYWQCEHCKANHVKMKNGSFEFYAKELPYGN